MTPSAFKSKLRECRSELEVRRLVHWHWPQVNGSYEEIMDCLNAADRMAQTFAVGEEGSLGEVCVDLAHCV